METLKASGNQFYQDIEINEDFLAEAVEGVEQPSDMETESQIHEKKLDEEFEKLENQAREAMNENGDKVTPDEDSDEEVDTRLEAVKKYQSKQNGNTCLLPRDISNDVIVNTGKTVIQRSAEEGKRSLAIAPGNKQKSCLH